MKEIIREIVHADKQARHRVKSKQQECNDIQNFIQKQKDDIKLKYQEETKVLMQQKKATLDEELAQQKDFEKKSYEDAVRHLEKQYEEHKEDWIKQMYDRCLNL